MKVVWAAWVVVWAAVVTTASPQVHKGNLIHREVVSGGQRVVFNTANPQGQGVRTNPRGNQFFHEARGPRRGSLVEANSVNRPFNPRIKSPAPPTFLPQQHFFSVNRLGLQDISAEDGLSILGDDNRPLQHNEFFVTEDSGSDEDGNIVPGVQIFTSVISNQGTGSSEGPVFSTGTQDVSFEDISAPFPSLSTGGPILSTGSRGTSLGGPILSTGSRGTSLGGPILSTGSRGTSLGGPILSTGSRGTSLGGPILPTGSRGTSLGGPILSTGSQGTSLGGPILSTGSQGTSLGGPNLSTGSQGTSPGGPILSTGSRGASLGVVGVPLPGVPSGDQIVSTSNQDVSFEDISAPFPSLSTGGPILATGSQGTSPGGPILSTGSRGASLGGIGVPLPGVSTGGAPFPVVSNGYSSVNVGVPEVSTENLGVSFSSSGGSIPSVSLGSSETPESIVSLSSGTISDLTETSVLPLPSSTEITLPSNILSPVLGMLLNGNTNNIDSSQTLGTFLMGLNGKNGVMVLPASSLEKVKNSGINVSTRSSQTPLTIDSNTDVEVRGNTGDDASDDSGASLFQVDSGSDSSSDSDSTALFPGGLPEQPSTTTEPSYFREPVTRLLFTKGKLLGTILGGIIDIGTTVFRSFSQIKPFA
ncbi:aggrecan core protein-like isoform X3 [Homarus americanus]|uniref:aggrecan core protein-like isoform X3 n=1 Tax=Homarus americanus TaxID=6706 RepID=UPI001C4635BD|nr:aggrecan core protein-like isoform X3 [Homarus americanus]